MKKLLVLTLIICLMLPAFGALADELVLDETPVVISSDAIDGDLGDFVVGSTSKLTGNFFTSMWGNNTSDIDVRQLIHGYSPAVWTTQPSFTLDMNIILNVSYSENDRGDKLYIIQLFDGLKYSDGSPITARDYAFSYMLGAAPQVEALGVNANLTNYIAGYDAYHSGASEVFAGVRIFDDLSFGVEISADYLPFFYEIGLLDTNPYPISVIAPGCEVVDDGQGAYIRNIDQSNTTPIFTSDLLRQTILDPNTGYLSHPSVTSGPYVLTSYDAASGVARFNINPYYTGNPKGHVATIDNVVMKQVLPNTMIDELANGSVQLLNKVVAADNILEGMSLIVSDQARQANYPRMGLGFISYTCDNGVFTSQSVRQAVAHLVDSDSFWLNFNKSFGQTVDGYYGVGQWMYLMAIGSRDGLDTDDPALMAQWDAITEDFNALNKYDFDAERAKQLLIDDGWTLNEYGDNFVEGVDTVRYKLTDAGLMGLVVRWGRLKDSIAADEIERLISQPFMDAGIRLEIDTLEYTELMDYYYRKNAYKYDMLYLATNFMSMFDPYLVFNTSDEYVGVANTTGFKDAQLEALALDMRRTEPADLYTYEQKWVAFQKAFNEKLPLLPVYSNMYFDFHSPRLTGYFPNSEASWPIALLAATYGAEVPVTEDATESDVVNISDDDWSTEDGELIFN